MKNDTWDPYQTPPPNEKKAKSNRTKQQAQNICLTFNNLKEIYFYQSVAKFNLKIEAINQKGFRMHCN